MATKTLLDATQNILSSMDSDEVNSVYDTVEALQVATIIIETIEAEFSNLDLPFFDKILQLTSVSDVNRPNYLQYGSDVADIKWLRYKDNRNNGRYKEVLYLSPTDFFDRIVQRSTVGTNEQQITDPSGVEYIIKTNSAPTFYTSVDNNYLIFDSYDSDFENTLEQSNCFCLGSTTIDSTELQDDYVLPVPNTYYPLLLAEAKSTCFMILKQMPSPKTEQVARRQRSRLQNDRLKTKTKDYPYASSKFNFARNR